MYTLIVLLGSRQGSDVDHALFVQVTLSDGRRRNAFRSTDSECRILSFTRRDQCPAGPAAPIRLCRGGIRRLASIVGAGLVGQGQGLRATAGKSDFFGVLIVIFPGLGITAVQFDP